MVTASTWTLLFGRDESRTRQWGVGAGMLLVASLLSFAAVNAVDAQPVHSVLWWEGYAVLLTTLVAVQSYSNGGLVVSWSLAFAAVVGLVLNHGGIGVTGAPPDLVELLGLATVGGMVAAAIVGTLGFGIGCVARRIAE